MSLQILRSFLSQRHMPFQTRRELETFQEKQVQKLLAEVMPLSPYTQERMRNHKLEDWHVLEPITKQEMMEHFDTLNTAHIRKEEAIDFAKKSEEERAFQEQFHGYTVGLSSGTSGRLGLFLLSEREQEEWVGRILAKTLPQHLLYPTQDRVAFFLRANSPLYERTASRRLRFEFFDLAKEMESHLSILEALKPTILIAPPSCLRLLVSYIQAKRLSIAPQKVITVAEPLDIIDERLFRHVFKQTIHQVYQATEGFLASTCAYGTLHLNEDLLIFHKEPLSAQRFVPVITDLFRTTQPIIRYRLDDVLRIRPTPCSCGSILTAIDAIEGRCDDVLLLSRADGSHRPVYADLWRRKILMSDPRILDYGLRQVGSSALELFIVSTEEKEVRSTVEEQLHKFIHKQGLLPITIHHVHEWPQGGLRKKKRIERCWSPSDTLYGESSS